MSIFQLPKGITCHAWSPDYKKIALCKNDEKLLIYKNVDQPFSSWVLEHELVEHTLVISAIDWSPVHNKIVSCSHDRTAFVWTFDNNIWKPSMAILRIDRAALDVKWSPDGNKFAVASGKKIVPVCIYEESNDWWISMMIKKHNSSVTTVAWHPNSQLLCTGGTDFRCRIFSTFIKEIDSNISTMFGNTNEMEFGKELVRFPPSDGWINQCAWSPNGNILSFVTHDSCITFAKFQNGAPKYQCIKLDFLPNQVLLFISDSLIVAGGHSFRPEFFQLKSDSWEYIGSCDNMSKSTKTSKMSSFSSARELWTNKTTRGITKNNASSELNTKHTNCITNICIYGKKDGQKVSNFSTSGLDGKIIIWDHSCITSIAGSNF